LEPLGQIDSGTPALDRRKKEKIRKIKTYYTLNMFL
jgi:hypothetical protein